MITVNMTREGLSAISTLIERSTFLSQILDGSSHFTKNCDWSFDDVTNRQTYKLHLPEDKLEILRFLFISELDKKTCTRFWGVDGVHFTTKNHAEKMLKRIVKAIKETK